MVPDLLHIIPVNDNVVFDGVLEHQDTTLGLRLIPNVAVHLVHANHDARYLWATQEHRHRQNQLCTCRCNCRTRELQLPRRPWLIMETKRVCAEVILLMNVY